MIFPLTLNQVKNFLREHKEGFSDYTARDNSYDVKLLNARKLRGRYTFISFQFEISNT